MIKCNFIDRSNETILPLYKSLVRRYLEYCCQVLNPYFNKDIKLIEGDEMSIVYIYIYIYTYIYIYACL